MSAPKTYKPLTQLLIYVSILVLLILTSSNINNYLIAKKVLGIAEEKQSFDQEQYWKNFLQENPDYIPGWIELGDFEKVKQIDPNYFLQP